MKVTLNDLYLAQHNSRREKLEQARMEPVMAEHAANIASTSPLGAAVLNLHKPVGSWPHCEGCDFEGYEAEYPDWPCATYTLVKEWQD